MTGIVGRFSDAGRGAPRAAGCWRENASTSCSIPAPRSSSFALAAHAIEVLKETPDVIDSVPVLSRHAVFNPEEVGRLEINRITADRDSAVPVAGRCDPIILGHDESLHGQAVGHPAPAYRPGLAEIRAAVGSPARVLDVGFCQSLDILSLARRDSAVIEATAGSTRFIAGDRLAFPRRIESRSQLLHEDAIRRGRHTQHPLPLGAGACGL